MNISVKNGSSVWQLATLWGEESVPTNFCSLFWLVTVRFGLISASCICAGLFFGCFFAGVAASISVGYVIWTVPITIIVALTALIFVIFVAAFIEVKSKKAMDNNPKGAISNTVNAYSSWKNKYCPKVIEQE
jgi:uncharacterized membrane protein